MEGRAKDLNTLYAFCQVLARSCPDLVIDLSLFNYKVKDGPKVRQAVRKNVPIAEAYKNIIDLLEDYDKGEDIMWRPAHSVYASDRTRPVNLIWIDDFKADSVLPWLEIKTSENKSQAYFLLSKAVPVEIADTIQKKMAKTMGDKAAGSFVQHRRLPGLVNGKYAHEPLVLMFGPFKEGILDPEAILKDNVQIQTNNAGAGTGVSSEKRPIKVLNYTAYIKDRKTFEVGNDQSSIDFSWALSMARTLLDIYKWPDYVASMAIMWELLTNSPEVAKRKKTPEHLKDYLIRTITKAIDTVKKTKETNSDTNFIL